MKLRLTLALVAVGLALAPAYAGPAETAIAAYSAQAGAGFAADPARGQAFFLANHTGGNPDTPSCSTCHTKDPTKPGQTRTGKMIDPMALSATPDRFSSSIAKLDKRFSRYCGDVLGRDCTAAEKADVIAYLSSI